MTEWHPLRSLPSKNAVIDDDQEHVLRQAWERYNHEAECRAKTIQQTTPAVVPSLDHTRVKDFDRVYEPSEDTFLLLDGIQYDLLLSKGKDPKDPTVEPDAAKTDSSSTPSPPLSSASRPFIDHIRCVMEIGTGSGVPITFLIQLLQQYHNDQRLKPQQSQEQPQQQQRIRAIATDINPSALKLAKRTAEQNGVWHSKKENDGNEHNNDNIDHPTKMMMKMELEFVQCDLATPFLVNNNNNNTDKNSQSGNANDLRGAVDCLIFNPPYVPTPDSEVVDVPTSATPIQNSTDSTENNKDTNNAFSDIPDERLIEASWAGGDRGRRVIDRAIPQIAALLSKPYGVAYMVTVDDNEPYKLSRQFQSSYQLTMKPLVRRRARNEYLTIQRISWETNNNFDNNDDSHGQK